jgi:N12 class adenine-specific DNA methylase
MPLDFTDLIPDRRPADDDDESRQKQTFFARNKAWARPDAKDFTTKLDPGQEAKFQTWVKTNKVPFDPDPDADYDMRGYWKASQDPTAWKKLIDGGKIDKELTKIDPNDGKPHYPDYWKTPYHETFSNESQWADPAKAPRWNDKDQLVAPDGKVVFDDKAQNAPRAGNAPASLSFDDLVPDRKQRADAPFGDLIADKPRPTISFDDLLPRKPPLAVASLDPEATNFQPVARVADAVAQGVREGYGTGAPSPEIQAANALATKDLGALAPVVHGINWLSEAGGRPFGAAFRGAQAGVAQIATEMGMPQLGRDLAAMPEAFAGMPEALRTPEPIEPPLSLGPRARVEPRAGGSPGSGALVPAPAAGPRPGGAAAELDEMMAEFKRQHGYDPRTEETPKPTAAPEPSPTAPTSGPAASPAPAPASDLPTLVPDRTPVAVAPERRPALALPAPAGPPGHPWEPVSQSPILPGDAPEAPAAPQGRPTLALPAPAGEEHGTVAGLPPLVRDVEPVGDATQAHGTVLGAGDLWSLPPDHLEEMLREKTETDQQKLVRAFGGEAGAREFKRLDRKRNSWDPQQADEGAREFDAKFGNLTPEQERLVYGTGEADAQPEDIKAVLDAHNQRHDDPDDAAYEAASAIRSVPAADIMAVPKGGASSTAQSAFVRLKNAYEDMLAAGVSGDRIGHAIAGALVSRGGWKPGDAAEIVGGFLDQIRGSQPRQPAAPAPALPAIAAPDLTNAHGGPWEPVGNNHQGETVFENPNGVRAVSENGVPWTERTKVGPDGAPVPHDPENRKSQFQAAKDAEPPTHNTRGQPYVTLPNGSPDLGKIDEDMAKEIGADAAPIRLTKHTEDHIALRQDELQGHGYAGPAEFVQRVAANFNEIWTSGAESLLLVQRIPGGTKERAHSLYVLLQPSTDGSAYEVQSGGVFRSKYPGGQGRKLLWQSARANIASTGSDNRIPIANPPGDEVGTRDAGARDQSKPDLGNASPESNGSDDGSGSNPNLRPVGTRHKGGPGAGRGVADQAGASGTEIAPRAEAPAPSLQPAAEQPISTVQEAENGVQDAIRPGDAGAGAEDVQPVPQGGSAGGAPDANGVRGRPNAQANPRAGTKGRRRKADDGSATGGGGASPGDVDRVPETGRPGDEGTSGRPDAAVKGENFRIEPGALAEGRSPRTKARDNVAAIELAQRLEAEKRPATKAEQAILAKYVGWGGLSGAFPNPETREFGKGLEDVGARLKQIMPEDEYRTAERSTQYAHYTAENVISAMWDAVRQMGFGGGSVFEPGMGIGHFLGLMPGELAAKSRYQGVEMDHTTARIARLLYPQSGVRQADFTRMPLPEDTFDLVIGNPPFSDTVISSDPKYAPRRFMLHDYFFAKSLDSVRPGGLLGFVTSAGTMNKMGAKAREYLAQRAEFLGGIRLPSTAFKKNAGTEVTTDILFFKRHPEGRTTFAEGKAPEWTGTVIRDLPNREGGISQGHVNRYFTEHPEMVLGKEGMFDKLVSGERYAVREVPGSDLDADLQAAIQKLPRDVMTKPQTPAERAALDFSSGQKKDGSFYIAPDGRLMQYSRGAGRPIMRRGKEGGTHTAEEIEQIRHLVPVRDALRDVFRGDLARDDAISAPARQALNKAYDAFVTKFGPLNKAERSYSRPTAVQMEEARLEARENARAIGEHFDDGSFDPSPLIAAKKTLTEIAKARQWARDKAIEAGRPFDEGSFDPSEMPDNVREKLPNVRPFMSDPESYRLRSIEDYDDATGTASKKDIFRKNILTFEREPEIKSANDAVLWSLNKLGRFDLGAITEKTGRAKSEIVAELGDTVFKVPGAGDAYQTKDEYLSGDVVSKLDEARAALPEDPAMARNIEALTNAIPAPLSPTDIRTEVGMPWVPAATYRDFAQNHLDLGSTSIEYLPEVGTWFVRSAAAGRYARTTEGVAKWSTPDRAADELLSDAMNRTPPKIYGRGPDGKPVFDPVATQTANDKMEEIKQAFRDWVEADQQRGDDLATVYNTKMNRTVPRVYDGSYLTTPGISAAWSWRPHQTRVVARIVQTGTTYMAHAVGAGKTSAMIGAGMEMRRLGLVKKPMYAVPNHMLGQFTKEFYEQYPTARIAVADERNFHTDVRKQFMANVAQDDLDAVIITHSSFSKIPISDGFQQHLIEEEIDNLIKAMKAAEDAGAERHTVKRLENRKEKLEQKLSKQGGGEGKDQTMTFEEMGVDFLFVDEAHLFRKLSMATKMAGLKGIAPEGSNMAWDLFTKIRYLDSQKPGRSAVLASGTPITNTMGELYTISRYLQPQELEKNGIAHFDSWVQVYADTKTALEQTASGSYAPQTRLSRFMNAPELYKMVSQIMDVVTSKELEKYVTRPQLKDGRRDFHLAERTEAVSRYQATLAQRMEAIKNRKGPPEKGDDILLSVINDGRHAAIDPRFVEDVPSDPSSKLNVMLDNVIRIHRETKDHQFYTPRSGYKEKAFRGPATQMIFANLGVNPRGPVGFSGYAWMKTALVRGGIPANEIAFIGDYDNHVARQNLFNDMNEGKVRVLIGSVQKMGTGVNAQRRLIAIHNQDPLWYPSDDEQRVGRGLRQGNMNPYLQVHDYSTKGTYDAVMWDMMGRKGRFIEQFFRGDPNLREMEDLGEAGMYEQAAGMATSDERVLHLTEMKQDLEKRERQASGHDREQYSLRSKIRNAEANAQYYTARAQNLDKDIAQRVDTKGKAFSMTVGYDGFTERKAAGEALTQRYNDQAPNMVEDHAVKLGTIGGFPLMVEKPQRGHTNFFLKMNGTERDLNGADGAALIASAESQLRGLEDDRDRAQMASADYAKEADVYRPLVGKTFEGGEKIAELRKAVRELEAKLKAEAKAAEDAQSGNPQEKGGDGSESPPALPTAAGPPEFPSKLVRDN